MTEDGYPDEEELKRVTEWPFNDLKGWFDYIKSIWWSPDWGFRADKTGGYSLHTGGWSGNEDIINAMQKNYIAWTTTWQVHRRGGHYEFVIPAGLLERP